jgi:hypothetical protein
MRVKSRTLGNHRSLDIEIPIPKPSRGDWNQKVKGRQDGDEAGRDDDDNDDDFRRSSRRHRRGDT